MLLSPLAYLFAGMVLLGSVLLLGHSVRVVHRFRPITRSLAIGGVFFALATSGAVSAIMVSNPVIGIVAVAFAILAIYFLGQAAWRYYKKWGVA